MINCAVIGCGYWGPNIVRNLHEIPQTKLKYCCDLNIEKLNKIKSLYPYIKIVQNSEEIFNDKDIDAVFIATPLSSHYELAKKALLAGKSVFVEKPFVKKINEGEELIKIAEEKNLTLMIGHVFEYAPAVIKIKELLDKNEIGKIYYITSTRVNLGIHRGDESVIWDLASHDLETIFYWIKEEPQIVQAMGKDSIIENNPDVAFITIKFPSNILVNIQVSWLAPSKLRNTVIVGEKKMIVYDDTLSIDKVKIFDKGVDSLEYTSFGEFQLSYRTGDMIVPILPNVEPLKEEIKHFIDCVRNKKIPKTNGYIGLKVVKYLQLIEESIKKEGKPLRVNS